MNRHEIPDWKLERYLLEELPQEQMEGIRHQIADDERLRLRLRALEASNSELLERYPPAWISRQISTRAQQKAPNTAPRPAKPSLWSFPALPGLALLTLVAVSSLYYGRDALLTGQPTTRIKGLEPHLQIYRKTAEANERLTDGAVARQGDLLQIRYQAAGQTHGVILSADGRGTITQHFPDSGEVALPLKRDQPTALDFSYQLDDAPQWERFYFISASQPFALKPLLKALEDCLNTDCENLDIAEPLDQSVFTLKKAGPHERTE